MNSACYTRPEECKRRGNALSALAIRAFTIESTNQVPLSELDRPVRFAPLVSSVPFPGCSFPHFGTSLAQKTAVIRFRPVRL